MKCITGAQRSRLKKNPSNKSLKHTINTSTHTFPPHPELRYLPSSGLWWRTSCPSSCILTATPGDQQEKQQRLKFVSLLHICTKQMNRELLDMNVYWFNEEEKWKLSRYYNKVWSAWFKTHFSCLHYCCLKVFSKRFFEWTWSICMKQGFLSGF